MEVNHTAARLSRQFPAVQDFKGRVHSSWKLGRSVERFASAIPSIRRPMQIKLLSFNEATCRLVSRDVTVQRVAIINSRLWRRFQGAFLLAVSFLATRINISRMSGLDFHVFSPDSARTTPLTSVYACTTHRGMPATNRPIYVIYRPEN